MIRFAASVLSLTLAIAFAGCGPDGPVKLPTMKISGKLTIDDKPFGPATLTLSPSDSDKNKPNSTGNVDKDGKISFVTYGEEGIAAATYTVTIAGDIMTMSTVPACEPITIEVKAGATSVDINLKSIPGQTIQGGLAPPVQAN
jgi:hypothetical protein